MSPTHTDPRKRKRTWVPRAPKRVDEAAIDGDGMALAALAASACRHAGALIAASLSASAGPVDRRGYEDRTAIMDRAWRVGAAAREFWWIIDESSQRRLLACVIGGSPAQSTSAVERTIVAETVARLASCGNSTALRCDEELRARPLGSMWRCDIELTQPPAGTAVLSIFTARRAAPARLPRPIDLRAVALGMNAELRPVRVRVGDLLRWRAGTVLELHRSADELSANLRLSPTVTASGWLGVVSGNRAVRLDRLRMRGQA